MSNRQRSPRRLFKQGSRWLAGMQRAFAESEAKLKELQEHKRRQQQQRPQAQLLKAQQSTQQHTNKEA